MTPPLGQLVQSFFGDYLPVQKGLRLARFSHRAPDFPVRGRGS